MENPNHLLTGIERAGLWAYFHKDWLLQFRSFLRPQLPPGYHLFVESESVLITPDEPQSASAFLPDIAVTYPRGVAKEGSHEVHAEATAAVIEVDEPCEIFSKYTLLIRRAPANEVVAVLELLSPSNKGLGNRLDQEKHLRTRAAFFEAGVNLLEIDALFEGQRVLPSSLRNLAEFDRNAWSAFHGNGRRRLRGWGWNNEDPLPVIPWAVEADLEVLVDLPASLEQASDFNRWEDLVAPAEGKS